MYIFLARDTEDGFLSPKVCIIQNILFIMKNETTKNIRNVYYDLRYVGECVCVCDVLSYMQFPKINIQYKLLWDYWVQKRIAWKLPLPKNRYCCRPIQFISVAATFDSSKLYHQKLQYHWDVQRLRTNAKLVLCRVYILPQVWRYCVDNRCRYLLTPSLYTFHLAKHLCKKNTAVVYSKLI